MTAEAEGLESRKEAVEFGGEAKFWENQIMLADTDCSDWFKDGQEVQDRYKRTPKKLTTGKSFNVLYSNTEVLMGALFARMAKPDIRRRFKDRDPVGRLVAEVVERAIIALNDINDPIDEYESAIKDYCLPGRGVVRVCYEARTSAADDGTEYVARQELWEEYLMWKDLRIEPAPSWAKVTWIAIRRRMSRDDLHANFDNSIGAAEVTKIPLNWTPDNTGDKKKMPETYKKAEVWEIWDKTMRQRIWIVKGYAKLLRKDKDPLGLEDFWPMAEPIQATRTNDTFVPQPEFFSYKDQADSLDEIETRIDRLTKALKRRGAYNAQVPELKKIGSAADNQFIAVPNWAELQSAGGLKGAYEVEDISTTAAVLEQLHAQRDLRLQTIYEIVGIADIMRGSTDPRETLGAQQLKAQFGGSRIKKRQDYIQRFIRQNLRLKAEIIAEHFEPEILSEITGFPWEPDAQRDPATGKLMKIDLQTGQPVELSDDTITQEVMNILRTDRLRSYRIDIETDSTVYEDAEAEKQARTELLTAMSQFVAAWVPILQAEPTLLPLAFELLAFGVRGFKAGRAIEEVLEQTKMQLEDAAKAREEQGPPQPPPDPAAEAAAAESTARIQRDDAKAQADAAFRDKQHQDQMAIKDKELEQQQKQHEDQMALERDKYKKTHKTAEGATTTIEGVSEDARVAVDNSKAIQEALAAIVAASQKMADAAAAPRQVIPTMDPRTGRIVGATSTPMPTNAAPEGVQ